MIGVIAALFYTVVFTTMTLRKVAFGFIGAPPLITGISPSRGGTEGGTRLTISGYNFAQNGIFSQYVVLIGGQPCSVINYYSSDGTIVCLTPKCSTFACQNNPVWQGSQEVSLYVYVRNVETIYSASSAFIYDGGNTPQLLRMSQYSWGSATSFISGKIAAAYLDDVTVFVGGGGNIGSSNAAYIGTGEDSELNPELWSNSNVDVWLNHYNEYPIFYRPPTDMTGGAYNLTFVVQDLELVGWGSGSARTFPTQYPLTFLKGYSYKYLYDAVLSGATYNLVLFPTISNIFPKQGSVGGGTKLTITGSGFSTNITNNIVYAGGQPCVVLTADTNRISCHTTPIEETALSSFISELPSIEKSSTQFPEQLLPAVNERWKYNSTRSYGSAGWWVKLWDWNAFTTNSYTDHNVRVSFGLRQGMFFGLYYDIGSDWPSQLNYASMGNNYHQYVADFSTLLIAPFTGTYTFYLMNSDDTARLYGAHYSNNKIGKEVLLVSATFRGVNYNVNYNSPEVSASVRIQLAAGERYYLRANLVNSAGPDMIHVALKIDPQYVNGTRFLIDGTKGKSINFPPESFSAPQVLSDQFLQHHAVRDIQLVHLSMDYKQEIQEITIAGIQAGVGVNSGYFVIIVQGSAATLYCADLTVDSDQYTIESTMSCAVSKSLNPSLVECSSFSVSKSITTATLSDGTLSSTLVLDVRFISDKLFPFTLLQVDTSGLTAASCGLTVNVTRIQQHSTLPSGSFDLTYVDEGSMISTAEIPYNANAGQVQEIFQEILSPEINVNVDKISDGRSRFSWAVTFVNPRGFVPQLSINASHVVGDNLVAYTKKLQNGSYSSIVFDPIPAWMTETPLRDVETGKDLSNVEVYIRSDSGDVFKSVCDNSGNAVSNELGMIKGNYSSCTYNYAANASAIISNFTMYAIDSALTEINIFGTNFQLAGPNKVFVTVSVSAHNCNITQFSNNFISCVVGSVSWGYHTPSVLISGYGLAVIATKQRLFFSQSIYSITPSSGSIAGGQIVTIKGRGLRPNASVNFIGVSEPCEIVSWTSTELKCRTPPSSSYLTHFPTSFPTNQPTKQPLTSPSSRPTHRPSVIPSAHPTQQPGNRPTTIPTSQPYSSPINYPTNQPTLRPTSNPTDQPTTNPLNNPTNQPTFRPISNPTDQPTTNPLNNPTNQPTFRPISNPTDQPITNPLYYPSRQPILSPISRPSTIPSDIPTQRPNRLPTLSPSRYPPTVIPSSRPSSSPYFFPSRKDANNTYSTTTASASVGPEYRRKLQGANDNFFRLTVDGFNTSLGYTYDTKFTPIIRSFYPHQISSGYTTNVTFLLSNYPSNFLNQNVSIVIGEQICNAVNKTNPGVVSCVLFRNASQLASSMQYIKIYFDNYGYASSQKLNELPMVERGFELFTSRPLNGSTLGGNVITIDGFGFDLRNPQRHIVQLSEEGLSPNTAYDNLLLSLGFPAYSNRSADQVLNCSVLFVNFTQIQCQLAPHSLPYRNNTYVISVTLNNLIAQSSSNLTYRQEMMYTPTISNDVHILSVSSRGEYTFTVTGTLLASGELSISVGTVPCTVTHVIDFGSYQKITVLTPPMTAGKWTIYANVSGKGVAKTKATINFSNIIDSVNFASPIGSIAGGAIMVINGFGFSTFCSENVVYMNADDVTSFYVTEFEVCSPFRMVVRTPSALKYFSTFKSAKSLNVSSISTYLTTSKNLTASKRFDASPPFTYSVLFTPFTTSNHPSGHGGTPAHFLIYPTGFGSSNVSIEVGSKNCVNPKIRPVNSHRQLWSFPTDLNLDSALSIQSQNVALGVECEFPHLPASSLQYDVLVYVSPIGYAIVNNSLSLPQYTSLLEAKYLTQASSSLFGGKALYIEGAGFSSHVSVSVCGVECVPAGHIFDTNFTCVAPRHLTVQGVNDAKPLGLVNNLIGSIKSGFYSSPISSVGTLDNLFDGNYGTYTTFSSKTCLVGVRSSDGFLMSPYRMRFYPQLQRSSYFNTVMFEGSRDGVNFISLGSVLSVHEGWNFVDVPVTITPQWFRYLRLRVDDTVTYKTSNCALAELDFLGVVASVNETCPVVLASNLTATKIEVGVLRYQSLSFTPVIQEVTPTNGTALGGTLVTLLGENLHPLNSTDLKDVLVSFSGVPCSVISASSSFLKCITGARSPDKIEVSNITVLIPGRGYAAINSAASYLYIDKWSALTSWQYQEPPVDGDIVYIPDGQVILLDTNTPFLTFLLVEGALYFDRSKDLTVDSTYIFILGGYMEVGTAEEPFEKSVVITLHGDKYSTIEVPPIGSKCLAVADKGVPATTFESGEHQMGRYTGQLEIHGQKRLRTWTKVNTTAFAGNHWLITSEPVDFKAGETIILTNSEIPDCHIYENCFGFEELVVEATYNLHNVTFTSPLVYNHRSEIVYVEGIKVDMRCEIGLLSRNIIIQGSADSDLQLFGVHTVAMQSGIYRIENAEVRRCGQAFNFGRYCTHGHKAGNMEGSYVKANSIHNTYQRAVTTHSIANWEVRDNVAYYTRGHAYFVEDGDEVDNYITGNLGVYSKISSNLLPSDQEPSIFWSATPNNFWRDNVAAHSEANGMWFEFKPPALVDPGVTPVDPQVLPVGEFKNNTFHSNHLSGFKIYVTWEPNSPQYLYGLNSFRNGQSGFGGGNCAVHGQFFHRGHTLVENRQESFYGGAQTSSRPYDMTSDWENCLFVGSLDPTFDENVDSGPGALEIPRGEHFYVKNSTFVNYGQAAIFTQQTSTMVCTSRFEQLRFVKSPIRFSNSNFGILWDLDGSLAGVPDSMIVPVTGQVMWPDACTVLSSFGSGVRCGGNGSDVRIRRVKLENVSPPQLYYNDVHIVSDAGVGTYTFLSGPITGESWRFPVVSGINRTYAIEWRDLGNLSPRTATMILGDAGLVEETRDNPNYDESVIIRQNLGYSHTWDYDPFTFVVNYGGKTKWAPNNTTKLLTKMADARYLNYTFDVMLNNKGATPYNFALSTEAKLCPPRGCPIPPPPNPAIPMRWSKKSSWANYGYKVPVQGQSVTITSDMWIVLDISPPKLAQLIIYGKLTFLSNETHPLSLTLSVQCIQLWGVMEILGQDNNTFAGEATLVIYGGIGASPPVIMGEGNYVGAKVISVAGTLAARGRETVHTWARLNSTVNAGANMLITSQEVSWEVGDEVVLSPTGFFDSTGASWISAKSMEKRNITAITTIMTPFGNFSQVTVQSPFIHTHLCERIHEEEFCGAVGLITRSIKFISKDCQTPKTTSYGFCAHIHVVDIFDRSPHLYGSIDLRQVELVNFGKTNSDRFAISIAHRDFNHPPSYVMGCSMTGSVNYAISITNANNITFSNNILTESYGGGVYIDKISKNFVVHNNLVLATYQGIYIKAPSVLYPVAAFTILSAEGICASNLVAGSFDQGFAIATTMFNTAPYQCNVTLSESYTYSLDTLVAERKVYDNEAVACKGGLFIVADLDSKMWDCALVSSFKGWRNAHTGIVTVDNTANVIIAGVVLAENHIGITLQFYKLKVVNVFSGIVASKIIGSLGLDSTDCVDLPDSLWKRSYHCQTLSSSSRCDSLISQMYRRVGLLLPQWTNAKRTCGLTGKCMNDMMPTITTTTCSVTKEMRFGLPVDNVYAEQHIHDTVFVGFQSYNFNSSKGSGCIPSDSLEYSPAIAINPAQTDMQPALITSRLTWENSNPTSHIAFGAAWFNGQQQLCSTCQGLIALIIHDIDGTLSNQGKAGQLLWGNPEYVGPSPLCFEVSELHLGLFFCPRASEPTKELIQYNAVWRDWGPQVIQPIFTTRHFTGEKINRTFASFGPQDEKCSTKFYFSQFPLFIANGTTHRLMAAGTTPTEFLIRWDAPTKDHVAIVEIFYSQSYEVNVLISNNPIDDFAIVPRLDRYPTLFDPAGSNARDPQRRILIAVLRGGTNRFYRFRQVPVVAVTMKLALDFSTFVSDNFVANMALLLNIPRKRIKIASVRPGSVIIDFTTTPNNTQAANKTDVAKQVADLEVVTATLSEAISSGAVEQTFNAPVLTCAAAVSHVDLLQPYDNLKTYPSNGTVNATKIRQAAIAAAIPVPIFLASYPTSQPSRQPGRMPTVNPTKQPYQYPTRQPTTFPATEPTLQPLRWPTTQPSSQPVIFPSVQPSRRPEKRPSKQPIVQPSIQPILRPSLQPSHQPSSQPSFQPSKQPFGKPSSRPSLQPSYQPSVQPHVRPSCQPSQQPYGQPSRKPSTQPFSNPTKQPYKSPSVHPSLQPEVKPSAHPSLHPISKPSCQPSQQPFVTPSSQPSNKPSKQPNEKPSSNPSSQPLNIPSEQPSSLPTLQPYSKPSCQPTSQPSLQPSTHPLIRPSTQPVNQPSFEPSFQPLLKPSKVPSIQPSCRPSTRPSLLPSCRPSKLPSFQPSIEPSLGPKSRPSNKPSALPFSQPSSRPTFVPSLKPISLPTSQPTLQPSSPPSHQPSAGPSTRPSMQPAMGPSSLPSFQSTTNPSMQPVNQPSTKPSQSPLSEPTSEPSLLPSLQPTTHPLLCPSLQPLRFPTIQPTYQPIKQPSSQPTDKPFARPSGQPTSQPTMRPSLQPSRQPFTLPSGHPTHQPTVVPSQQPVKKPTYCPIANPTIPPTFQPSLEPTGQPNSEPTFRPTSRPIKSPVSAPSKQPFQQPTRCPSSHPNRQPSFKPIAKPVSRPSRQPVSLPTSTPSSSEVSTVSFQASLPISGVTASSLISSPTAKAAIISAATVPVGRITPDVSIASITSTTQTKAKMKLSVDAQVTLSIAFVLSTTGGSSLSTVSDNIYKDYTKSVSDSVKSGSFAKNLQSSGGVLQSAAVSGDVLFTLPKVQTLPRVAIPSSRPSTTPKHRNGSSPSIDIGLLVGLLVAGLALLMTIAYLVFFRKKLEVTTAKIIPDTRSEFFDLETVDNATFKRKSSPGVANNTNILPNLENINYDEASEPAEPLPELSSMDVDNRMDSPALFTSVNEDHNNPSGRVNTDQALSLTSFKSTRTKV